MDRLGREAEPLFRQPVRQITLMVMVLVLVGAGAWVAFPTVAPMFLANPWLNFFIAFVFVIGVFACFWQVVQLIRSVIWIEGFAQDRPGHQFTSAPRLLATLAALLRGRGARVQLGPGSARSILDSVATRIDEARDITRYIVNLLIFLGLLGTFYGLATTVPAVVDTIRSLAPAGSGEDVNVFERLIGGLEDQLGGMGVAFSSSLIGLAGSLVVGLLELFASHGQNRFYRELEDWLSTITRLGYAGSDAEGEFSGGGAVAAVLDRVSEHMETLAQLYERSEAGRGGVDERLIALSQSVERLVQRVEGEGAAEATLGRLAAGQERLAEALETRLGEAGSAPGEPDAETRMRLRSLDVQLLRVLEDMASGRQEMLDDLRTEIRQLTRAVEALGREG